MLFSACLFLLFSSVLANVEKAIFLAPPTTSVPQHHPNLDDLYLIPLSPPDHKSVRTHLNASFPTSDSPRGTVSWFLLDGLNAGQRYEVRICWLATQPTSFWLTTHTLEEAFGAPELITSLSHYAYAQEARWKHADAEALKARRAPVRQIPSGGDPDEVRASILLLEVHAAADYFSLNRTLMENVPPVLVDIILDPYILNVFPESLVPTAGYLVCIAVIAWFISGYVWKFIKSYIAATPPRDEAAHLISKKTL